MIKIFSYCVEEKLKSAVEKSLVVKDWATERMKGDTHDFNRSTVTYVDEEKGETLTVRLFLNEDLTYLYSIENKTFVENAGDELITYETRETPLWKVVESSLFKG